MTTSGDQTQPPEAGEGPPLPEVAAAVESSVQSTAKTPPSPEQPTGGQIDHGGKGSGNQGGNGSGNGKEPTDPVEEAERALREAQKRLEEAKANKAEAEQRAKDLDAIHTQQRASQVVVDRATGSYKNWVPKIEPNVLDEDEATIRQEIDEEFANIVQAEGDVEQLRKQAITAEYEQKIADAQLAALQAQRADAQKKLSQLVARIKDGQSRVEKLVAEVKSAIDAKKWRLAFGKNYQLDKTITEVKQLLESEQKEQTILKKLLKELEDLRDQITQAQTEAENKKTRFEDTKRLLKDAEEILKQRRASLDATIVNLSSRASSTMPAAQQNTTDAEATSAGPQ